MGAAAPGTRHKPADAALHDRGGAWQHGHPYVAFHCWVAGVAVPEHVIIADGDGALALRVAIVRGIGMGL